MNPFAPAVAVQEGLGVFGDARLLKSKFLYRKIRLGDQSPLWPGVVAGFGAGRGQLDESSRGLDAVDHGDQLDAHHLGGDHISGDQIDVTYTGWWFLQRVYIQGVRAWWAISWLNLRRSIQFELPGCVVGQIAMSRRDIANPEDRAEKQAQIMRIEIDFGQALRIRRFRLWVNDRIRYDEIN